MSISRILGPSGERILVNERPKAESWWWDLYEAADRRDFRGWFFLPKLSPAEQMDWLTYRAIAERSDWIYKNVGAATMVIDGLAVDEVGGSGLWPKWITGQDDFDSSMTDAFHYANHEPRVFSTSGHFDNYTAQLAIRRMIRLWGDCFGQEVRPTPGSGNAQLHLIPGFMIDNYSGSDEKDGWTRGVKTNDQGRPLFYRVLNQEGGNGQGYRDIPADEMLHFHEPFLAGQQRGMPALTSVARMMFKREDIKKAIAAGTLAREQVAWAIETDATAAPAGPGFPGVTQTDTITNPDGSKLSVAKIFGYNATEQVRIPQLTGGRKLKAIESNRPGTEVMKFQDSILIELAYSTKYPPEYVFFLGGMGQGTVARLVVEKVRENITAAREFQLRPQFYNRWNVFWAWQRIKSGYFKSLSIEVPTDWWKHKMVPPRDISVDLGREGRLFDERVEGNKMSIESYHGLAGEDAGDVEDENYAAVRRRCKKIDALNKSAEVKALGMQFNYFDLHPRTGSYARDSGTADKPAEDNTGKTEKQPNKNNRRNRRANLNGSRP